MSRRIRIELDQEGARALHAALTATLAADAVDADQIAAARGVLEQLDRRVPDRVAHDPSQAVLAALARERWAAISPTPHWRIPAPSLPYRPLPVQVQPSDQACPSEACDGRAKWLKAAGRTATWRALTRDGSVEWTCPSCSRTWLVYLQACTHDGAPQYRDPVDGDHNRPYWRSGR